MTINNITFTSTNATRIYLPCQINGDLLWEASKALWESGRDIQDIASITIYLVPHISPIKPLIGYRLEITTTDDQRITRHIKADFTTEQTVNIIDRFFEAGAPGLAQDMCRLFENQYNKFKSHRQAA